MRFMSRLNQDVVWQYGPDYHAARGPRVSSGALASMARMISGERALEIEKQLAQLLDAEVGELRDYLAGDIGASPTRKTGFRFVRGTHGGQYVRDRDGTDIVRAGVLVP